MSELPLKINGLISGTVGASQMALLVKNPPANERDLRDGSIPEWGRSPAGSHDNSLRYSCLENPHGQRSLEGYSPWGFKESDSTEQLSAARWTWCNVSSMFRFQEFFHISDYFCPFCDNLVNKSGLKIMSSLSTFSSKIIIYESESHLVISDSLRPAGQATLSMGFPRQEY